MAIGDSLTSLVMFQNFVRSWLGVRSYPIKSIICPLMHLYFYYVSYFSQLGKINAKKKKKKVNTQWQSYMMYTWAEILSWIPHSMNNMVACVTFSQSC